jgi:hypothetical protein
MGVISRARTAASAASNSWLSVWEVALQNGQAANRGDAPKYNVADRLPTSAIRAAQVKRRPPLEGVLDRLIVV